ncbi:MAG: DUF11 domain-containing protein [Anaerolineae bacterium]|uniref:C25 family cysteine peptidase n=1 Tax=Candidatus Amarolinea dominans TaxID=3140696 RepID=UPI003135897A|nr:DUF11 domain-containing protein [Anaerolineae bacterium]
MLTRLAPGLSVAVVLAASLLFVLLAGATVAAPPPGPVAAPQPPAALGDNSLTLTTDGRGLTVDLRTNAYELESVTLDGAPFVRLSAPDTTPMGDPGTPEIPVRNVLLAVPVGATVKLTVLAAESETIPLTGALAPAPSASPRPAAANDTFDARPDGLDYVYLQDPDLSQQDAWLPAVLASVDGDSYLREQRVVRLSLRPFQVNPGQQSLRIVHHLRVRIDFVGQPVLAADASAVSPYEPILRSQLLNYEQGKAWRVTPAQVPLAARPAAAQIRRPQDTGERWRVEVDHDGLVALDYATLRDAGVPVDSLDPRHFRLWRDQQEVALLVEGESDGRFDASDRIIFYGQQTQSRYTTINVYWLTQASANGLRMTTRSAPPQVGTPPAGFWRSIHFQESHFYLSDLPREEGADHWYWASWSTGRRGAAPTHTITVTLPGLLPDAGGTLTATLRPNVYGQSSDYFINPDHHLRFLVNGIFVGNAYFDGLSPFQQTYIYNQSLLQTGDNVFQLNAVSDIGMEQESGHVQWYEVGYWQAARALDDQIEFTGVSPVYQLADFSGNNLLLLDISNPLAPVRLTDYTLEPADSLVSVRFSDGGRAARYVAQNSALASAPRAVSADTPSSLGATSNQADMIIISPETFLDSLAPLVSLRQSQGLRVSVINVQDVYDEFSGGVFDAEALHSFLAYAYYNWQSPPPRFVLLVGDGHYDFKNFLGTNAPNPMPPYLKMVDPYLGETSSDNRLVTVAGNDVLADMAIGRLPVNTYDEINALVSKIVNYETVPLSGDWYLRHLFITDNPDGAGNFWNLSNAVADVLVHAPYVANKIYFGQPPFTSPLATRQAILNAYNQGALIVSYVGHSSIPWWAAEILFSTTQVPLLNNEERTPIMLPMTCYDGYFHDPRFPSLGETVVRVSGRGAVASWSATGLGVAHGHDYLERGFYTSVFINGNPSLGDATTVGKVNLYTSDPRFLDLVDTYLLFGDPAMNVALIDTDLQVSDQVAPAGPLTQGERVTYTMHYTNAGPAAAANTQLTLELPESLLAVSIESSAPITADPITPHVWSLGALAAGATGVVTVTAQIAPDITPADLPLIIGGHLRTTWRERTQANNGQSYTLQMAPADPAVSLLTAPASVIQPGDRVTFTIGYVNQGAGIATQGLLTFPLPAGVLAPVITFSGPALTAVPGSAFAWRLPDLPLGAGGQVIVAATVDPNLAPGQSVIAGVVHLSTAWLDSNTANNQASASLLVNVVDAYEPDDGLLQASYLLAPGVQMNHTCHRAGDVDWIRFDARSGVAYYLRTFNLTGSGDTVISLHDSLGNELAKNDDYLPGSRWSGIDWTAAITGKYFMRIIGSGEPWCGFRYDVRITTSLVTFLPTIGKLAPATRLVSQP